MARLKSLLDPKKYAAFVQARVDARRMRLHPNFRGAFVFPPGHFYSPLLDIEGLDRGVAAPSDGPELWEHLDLRQAAQRAYYEDLLRECPLLPFPRQRSSGFRYFSDNQLFGLS